MEEKSISLKLWKESEMKIPFGVIDGFISVMTKQKPHLQIESLQFQRFSYHILSAIKDDYYLYAGDNIQPKYLVEQNVDYDLNDYENEYTPDYTNNCWVEDTSQKNTFPIVKWAYFKAFDSNLNIYKTIKVQFLEIRPSNISKYKELLMVKLKDSIVSLDKQELILKIYDYYFLSSINDEISQYFVIEQELVQSTFKNYLASYDLNSELKSSDIWVFQQKCFLKCLKQLGVYYEYNFTDTATFLARFYVTQTETTTSNLNSDSNQMEVEEKGQSEIHSTKKSHQMEVEEKRQPEINKTKKHRIKVSPFDFFMYLGEIQYPSLIQSQQQYQQQYYGQQQANQNLDGEQIFIKLNCGDYIFSLNLPEYVQTFEPDLFQYHSEGITEMVQHLSLNAEYKLLNFDSKIVIFQAEIEGMTFNLNLVQQIDVTEAKKMIALFETFKNIQQQSKFNKCELLQTGEYTYLLYIKEDLND